MKKFYLLICSFVVLSLFATFSAAAMGGPAPKAAAPKTAAAGGGESMLIDDFESGNLQSFRKWWTFDISQAEVVSNKGLAGGEKDTEAKIGNYSLKLSGNASNWYVGGCGAYIAKEGLDLSRYAAFQMDVYGNGEGSGSIKIELFDDDNNNWQVEQDPKNSYAPVYDDKFVYNIAVDWKGWQKVNIPLVDFVDDNSGVGDDIWNPSQGGGSGGFLQVQFICLAGEASGKVNYNLDNILLTVEEE